MHTLLICLAAATIGFDVGWQRLPEGGTQYIIQLDPQTLESLKAGQPIQSDIPPTAGEIRSYCIKTGNDRLPRDTPPPKKEEPKPPPVETTSEPQKPWLPLTLTMIGLFASIGVNVFLGWIAFDCQRRYACKSPLPPGEG